MSTDVPDIVELVLTECIDGNIDVVVSGLCRAEARLAKVTFSADCKDGSTTWNNDVGVYSRDVTLNNGVGMVATVVEVV